jgi:hypothetical protein
MAVSSHRSASGERSARSAQPWADGGLSHTAATPALHTHACTLMWCKSAMTSATNCSICCRACATSGLKVGGTAPWSVRPAIPPDAQRYTHTYVHTHTSAAPFHLRRCVRDVGVAWGGWGHGAGRGGGGSHLDAHGQQVEQVCWRDRRCRQGVVELCGVGGRGLAAEAHERLGRLPLLQHMLAGHGDDVPRPRPKLVAHPPAVFARRAAGAPAHLPVGHGPVRLGRRRAHPAQQVVA